MKQDKEKIRKLELKVQGLLLTLQTATKEGLYDDFCSLQREYSNAVEQLEQCRLFGGIVRNFETRNAVNDGFNHFKTMNI